MLSLFLNKVFGWRPAILLKKRLYYRCFPVNFSKLLRTPFDRTPQVTDSVYSQKLWKIARKPPVPEFCRMLYWVAILRITIVGGLFCFQVLDCITTWNVSKYGVISVRMRENTDKKKLRIWTLFTQCMCILLNNVLIDPTTWKQKDLQQRLCSEELQSRAFLKRSYQNSCI